MATLPLLIIYCLLILLASIAGGLVPLYVHLTHRRMELAVSFVAGVMLGVGIMHLLAHALVAVGEQAGSVDGVLTWLLVGVLVMFFFERFFCYHHHEAPAVGGVVTEDEHEAGHAVAVCGHAAAEGHSMTWSGATLGLTLHSLVGGVALAASVAHEHQSGEAAIAGLSAFVVIFLHKPFDSLMIGTLMAQGGWPAQTRHVVNALFALAIPLGVVAFHVTVLRHAATDSPALPYALAFSAGTFLCIAMSDILPELQFHSHDRVKLSCALLAGLTVAWAISFIEMGHQHG